MKIDGTDPLILNKMQGQVRRQEVQRLGDIDPGSKIIDMKKNTVLKNAPRSYKPHVEELEQAVRQANETVELFNLGIRFKLHDSSERFIVQIVNRVDNTVIKEIPPERLLNLVGQIQEMIGLLLDEKR